jgi:small subunit ribosomal protein S3
MNMQLSLKIWTAKPGIVIGRKGVTVNNLRQNLEELTSKKVHVDVEEVSRPEVNAQLVAEGIAQQIERRISYKRAMKQAVQRALRFGAEGAMITCSGRLHGAEMARRETTREGRVPRHTLRADIDYAQAEALTTFGRIGIKVWIYKGVILPERDLAEAGSA